MNKRHKLLERQVSKHLAGKVIPPEFEFFLSIVSETYNDYEKDRELLERAMAISSDEVTVANLKAKQEFEQKLIAQKIAYEKEQILESINDNVSEAVYRTTPKSGILFINRAFIELFGFNSEEEVYNTLPESLYADPEYRFTFLQKLGLDKFVKGEEILFRKKDGSTFWGMVNSVSLTDKDGNIYYDGAIIDITQQKNNAKELQQINDALLKTNQELDSFVYSIGHDLRAPIASTLGLIELCKKEEDLGKIKYYNELKERSLYKLDTFIKDVLGYSRNARMGLDLIPVTVENEFLEILSLLETERNEKNISISIQVSPPDGKFLTDNYRFSLIFSNLISNAIRYHSSDKSGKYIIINASIKENSATFTVSDNGEGIPPVHIEKIFDMFYRGNKTSKGSGLGLYIAKEAVTKLKGQITVESMEGVGTCFTVTLPNLQVS